jgi:two-component system sensor histidine kinase ResE
MYRLVVDLLELARLDAGTAQLAREPLDLAEILTQVVHKFKPLALYAGVELSFIISQLPMCVGDQDRLDQVFTNLVDNAIKYTPPGGLVSVEAVLDVSEVKIHFRDTGQGIPEKDVPRVFERFYQVDKSRRPGQKPGTGLGLAIARQIIEAHQGTISVMSEIENGSVFTVSLPVVLPGDETQEHPQRPDRKEA